MIAYEIGRAIILLGCLAFGFWLCHLTIKAGKPGWMATASLIGGTLMAMIAVVFLRII